MIVIKFGGHAMRDEGGLFSSAIKHALSTGEQIVVVHGGGPQIDKALNEAGIATEFHGGFRVTTTEVFAVVRRVLVEEIGPALAEHLRSHSIAAVSISGEKVLTARKLTRLVDGTEVDLGYVGEVLSVDDKPLRDALENGMVVVLSPVAGADKGGPGFNVNADLAAAAVAGALQARALIVMTNVPGIYRRWPDEDSLISSITAAELSAIKSDFEGGMAPKVQACLDAITQGARAVRIIDGTDPAAFSLALSGQGGTLVMA